MDDALPWRQRFQEPEAPAETARTGSTARFGGDDRDAPVLVAVIQGPVESAMARDALIEAGVPAFVKHNSLGQVYGLTVGSFGAAEVWSPPTHAAAARDVLIGIGLLDEDAP